MILLDASAILAFLLSERGAEHVRDALTDSAITSVNLIEVLRKLRRDLDDNQVKIIHDNLIGKLRSVEEVTDKDVLTASSIYALHQRSANISLGDACCLAVGLRLSAEVWTADATWAQLPDVGRIRLVR